MLSKGQAEFHPTPLPRSLDPQIHTYQRNRLISMQYICGSQTGIKTTHLTLTRVQYASISSISSLLRRTYSESRTETGTPDTVLNLRSETSL